MTNRPTKILVVDREDAVRRAVAEILARDGHEIVAIGEPKTGLAASRDPSIQLALLDLETASPSGPGGLASIRQARPDLEIVVLTAWATVAAAIEAVKAGASDYLTKPFGHVEEVRLAIAKAIERKALRDRTRYLEELVGEMDWASLPQLPYAQAKRIALRAFERRYLTALLQRTNFNVSSAARAAGVDRSNFRRLLKQYEVARGKLAAGGAVA
jgi:DNA-binding NtrC family response regulator